MEWQIDLVTASGVEPWRLDIERAKVIRVESPDGREDDPCLEEDLAIDNPDPQRPNVQRDVDRVLVVQGQGRDQRRILDEELPSGAIQTKEELQIQRKRQNQGFRLRQACKIRQIQAQVLDGV